MDLRRRDGYISIYQSGQFGHRFNRSSFLFSASFTLSPLSLSPVLLRFSTSLKAPSSRNYESLYTTVGSLHYFLLELSTGKGSVEHKWEERERFLPAFNLFTRKRKIMYIYIFLLKLIPSLAENIIGKYRNAGGRSPQHLERTRSRFAPASPMRRGVARLV